MVVTTSSGSQYIFTDKDNKIYFMHGLLEGIVESLEGLKVGSRLTINFHKLNPYNYTPQRDVSVMVTSPIKEISY